MHSKIKIIAFILCFVFLIRGAFAQKIFQISIQFPCSINTKKIQLKYDNGKRVIAVTDSFHNQKLTFKGEFYSKTFLYNKEFFVQANPATLVFLPVKGDPFVDPLDSAVLINAVDITKTDEGKALEKYTLPQSKDLDNFFLRHEAQMSSNNTISKMFYKKVSLLADKELEFVKKTSNSYFSFWLFRTRVLTDFLDSEPLLLLSIFDNLFPKEFTESIEGEEVKRAIEGKLFTKKNYAAPNFSAEDILGQNISLKGYRGKYVLLDFWASWCGPCMEKVPIINKIRSAYPVEKLEIIGSSCDTDSSAFAKAINKNKMKWTHIYGDTNLRKAYGNKPIPSLYLIDKDGIIIYNSWEDTEDKLISVLHSLLGKTGK